LTDPAPGSGGGGGWRRAGRALATRNYRIYTTGNAVSLIGTWVQRIAVGWLAWRLTRSGAWLGLVSFADLFPTVLLSPLAGAIADRRDRLAVIRLTQVTAMAQAVLLALLTALGWITIEMLFVLTALLGAANAINQPARLATIPSLVDRADLPAAVAINSLIFNGARFVGPAVAGALIAAGSVELAFAVNAASYGAFLVALWRLDLREDRPPPAAGSRRMLGAMADGYLYAVRHEGIGAMLLMMAVTSLCTRGFVELLPGFADAVFGRGADGLAILTATVGLGAVVGGLWMARRAELAGLTRLVVAAVLLTSAALVAFAATDRFALALPCLFAAGFGMIVTGVAAQTLVQSTVDAGMRGRVMALYGMIFRGGPALGALFMGTASDSTGLRAPVAAGAVLCTGFWIWAKLREKQIAAALEHEPDPA
jgi:predicted MFS family arabinose efflux permease